VNEYKIISHTFNDRVIESMPIIHFPDEKSRFEHKIEQTLQSGHINDSKICSLHLIKLIIKQIKMKHCE